MPFRTLRLALRRLRRHPVYAALNGIGLAIGLAVFLLISLYVYHEHTYDTHHPEADRIVRFTVDYGGFGMSLRIPAQVARRVAETYPSVEAVARLYQEDVALRIDERRLLEEEFMYADPSIFDLFALPLLRGSTAGALDNPDTAVLTEDTARRLFGSIDVVGETLPRAEGPPLRVTGVLKALPSNTHLAFDALISYGTLRRGDLADRHAQMFGQQGYAYFMLTAPDAASSLQTKLDALVDRGPEAVEKVTGLAVTNMRFGLQRLTDLHLTPSLEEEMTPPVDPRMLWMFGGLGVFILGIAIINYVNLATAQATRRAMEVGVRKTMGAHRSELVRLFLDDALVLSLAAVAGAAVLIEVLRPLYDTLLGTSLSALSFRTPVVWMVYLAAAGGVALLAGSYPAWVLTRYRPAEVMRGTGGRSIGGRRFRQGLVVFQFAASIVLIALTFVIREQVDYAMQKPLGYSTENLVTLPLASELGEQLDIFRQEAERLTGVEAAARGQGAPMTHAVMMAQSPTGGDPLRVNMVYGDARYPETVGFDLLAGRTYTSRPADSTAVLVNETAARMYDLYDRLDQPLSESAGPVREGQRVVGIVSDFHTGSFREPIRPTVIDNDSRRYDALVIRLQPERMQDALGALEQLWYRFVPNQPFLHRFTEEAIQQQYRQEQTLAQRLGAFALLAVLVAGLGLFGLAAFTAEQRTKEMSIRKVLGASVAQIVMRLNREFVALVGIAFVVALPLAVWVAQRWLQDFAYRMDLSPGLFAWAGGLALLAALVPVSYHALRAAAADPATTLRDE